MDPAATTGLLGAACPPIPEPSAPLVQLSARPLRPLDPSSLDPEAWERLVEEAWRHGMLGPLVDRVTGGPGALPPAARARLELCAAALARGGAALRAERREALAALRDAGIRAVELKGPTLADRLHARPDLRPSSDVDLLVAAVDLDRAVDALGARGWRAEPGLHPDYERRHHHHVTVRRPGRPGVELHHRAASGFGTAVEGEPFLERARPGPGGDLLLEAEDELLLLSFHAAVHHLERFVWLEDLLSLLQAAEDVAWVRLSERARASGAAGALAFTLRRLAALGADVPPGVLAPLGRRRASLAEHLRRRHGAARRKRVRGAWDVAFQLVLADGAWRAARLGIHQALWFVRRRFRALRRSRRRGTERALT